MTRMKTLAVVLLAAAVSLSGCRKSEQAVTTTQPAGTSAPATTASESQPPGTDVGAPMPEYSAMWLDGSKFELASKRDKVVLLNVWATWCGPCRYEIPELQAIHDRFAPQGFEVIGVSVDESGIEAVRQFVTEQKMTYPVALDAEGKLANILQTSVLPTSVIVDRSGRIVWKKYGLIEKGDQELESAIQKALAAG
jgi:thiol-disulfide isomerase/thioredoxin